MKVLVVKDEEGELRPGAGIWAAKSEGFARAVKDEWKANTSKKKSFRGCSLVECELTELT